METTLQQKKQNKITREMKRRKNTMMNLMKGNPELTAKSEKIIKEKKKQQDLIIKGKRIKQYRFNLTPEQAARNAMFRKVREAQKEKTRERATAIPGPPIPRTPQPYFFLPAKKGRTRKRQFPQKIIEGGGRRTRRKRRNRKRKTKKKRRKRRTKKKRRKRRRKTRR